jgi:uncharacterized protein YbjT (DUF2867 family)
MRIAVAGGTGVVGRHTVDAAKERGHDVVVLSRSSGVDLREDAAVSEALVGVDVVIDAANSGTISGSKSLEFFTDATGRLSRLGASNGVSKLVVLSIVGIDRFAKYGYYRAKVAQEQVAIRGPVAAAIVRATQFHEFPSQILQRSRIGPIGLMPVARVQSVAAASVGRFLVESAESDAVPADPVEVAGPDQAWLVDLARSYVRSRGPRTAVVPLRLPGSTGKLMRSGGLLPGSGAHILGPTFAEWMNQ